MFADEFEKIAAGMPGAAKGVALGSGFAKAPGVAKHMTSGIKPPVVVGLHHRNVGSKLTGGLASLNRPLVGQMSKTSGKLLRALKRIGRHVEKHGYGPAIAIGSLGTAIGANRTANKRSK